MKIAIRITQDTDNSHIPDEHDLVLLWQPNEAINEVSIRLPDSDREVHVRLSELARAIAAFNATVTL